MQRHPRGFAGLVAVNVGWLWASSIEQFGFDGGEEVAAPGSDGVLAVLGRYGGFEDVGGGCAEGGECVLGCVSGGGCHEDAVGVGEEAVCVICRGGLGVGHGCAHRLRTVATTSAKGRKFSGSEYALGSVMPCCRR